MREPFGGEGEGQGPPPVEEIEIELLLQAIYRHYGYNFRDYARSSLRRRVRRIASALGVSRISELIPRFLHDEELFARMLGGFSTPVTEMFRDPPFFKLLRDSVVPYLKTYPFVRIWIAGCATGEEVYSIAILLREEGIYERCTVYATDFVDPLLQRARDGIVPLRTMKANTANYLQSGGKGTLSDYYHADYEWAILSAGLKENITFANHNLVTDGVFGEMHLILCRNVLIYFNSALQRRVLGLFDDSLLHGGFLALGSKESLRQHDLREKFSDFEPRWKIYRKGNGARGAPPKDSPHG